ncbi:epididymal protein 13 [Cavia porcellus]|uniref:epididymal protein 13 n=1 Tax=Cavia porcellus TaxID=10141 RepID=UPI000C878804|nr:epididymal protein 13-like [Cavia porcellus]
MCRLELLAKLALVTLVLLGRVEACVPREGGPLGPSSSLSRKLRLSLGLLSLQVLTDETSDCSEEKLGLATTPGRPVQRRNSWSLLRCTYMVVTFLFVSYNKGDWCYCHYCNPDTDVR